MCSDYAGVELPPYLGCDEAVRKPLLAETIGALVTALQADGDAWPGEHARLRFPIGGPIEIAFQSGSDVVAHVPVDPATLGVDWEAMKLMEGAYRRTLERSEDARAELARLP